MHFRRESGLVLHPTSLPGPYGMGEIGPQAEQFVDALQAMGQHLWQVLPLGPTGYGDSPYQSPSTFAGNTLLVSLDKLVEAGLLTAGELSAMPRLPEDHVAYGDVIPARRRLLGRVCEAFSERATADMKARFRTFCARERAWLTDFALFSAIKSSQEERPWQSWPKDLAMREPAALEEAAREHAGAIRHAKILQFLFHEQWTALRAYAHARNVRIIGDIPIFVAYDSADVWAHPELFFLDEKKEPTVVAGVPPDYFSATGQLWGNPLYNWAEHQRTGYAWWAARMRKMFEVVDILRIDHFRGFEAYWEVPAGEETAIHGRWVKGPGADFFQAMRQQLGRLPIIAEDLGVITDEVDALRDAFEFPGMRVLHFAFGTDDRADTFKPHNYPENCFVYTGTHDNDTTRGWYWSEAGENSTRSQEEIEDERHAVRVYLSSDASEIEWDLIKLALASRSNTAMIPLQDVLGLGTEGRMNVPGTEAGNWQWRFTWDQLDEARMGRLREIAEATGRVHEVPAPGRSLVASPA